MPKEFTLISNELPANPTPWVGLDLEVFGMQEGRLHRPIGTFACLSIAMEDGRVYQIYNHEQVAPALARLENSMWVFQNGMFDIRQLRRWASLPPRQIWDTMLVEQGLYGGYYAGFSLEDLSIRYLHEPMSKEVRATFNTSNSMTQEQMTYAARDAWVTLQVARMQETMIRDGGETNVHYWEADLPALWALLDMGPVHLDVAAWNANADQMEVDANKMYEEFPFNPNSVQQIKKYFETELRVRMESTDIDHLTALAEEHSTFSSVRSVKIQDVALKILEYRHLKKATSTYGRTWVEQNVENDWEVWSNYRINGAETGRMASSEPNLQNIPSRKMPIYRSFFVTGYPDTGCLSIGDVSQQEPRILAYLSKDEKMLDAIQRGESTHVMVGRELFDAPDFDKYHPMYGVAKAINLGLDYGLTEYGLSRKIKRPVEVCKQFLDTYFRKFPGVRNYIDAYQRRGMAVGFVRTTLGRRIFLNPFSPSARNNCINGPVQGTAAEQMKLVLGFLHRELPRAGLPFAVIMPVHDELVSDLPDKEMLAEYQAIEDEAWRYAGQRTVPGIAMKVEHGAGSNWGVGH